MTTKTPILVTYWRNMEWFAFARGWDHVRLATELGITMNTLNRLRFGRARYIDPEMFDASCEVFNCQPNDLLLPQPEVERRYANQVV